MINLDKDQIDQIAECERKLDAGKVPIDGRYYWDGKTMHYIPSEQQAFADQLFSPAGLRRLFSL